eukprot:1744052-Prymnesium_polylepis.1
MCHVGLRSRLRQIWWEQPDGEAVQARAARHAPLKGRRWTGGPEWHTHTRSTQPYAEPPPVAGGVHTTPPVAGGVHTSRTDAHTASGAARQVTLANRAAFVAAEVARRLVDERAFGLVR